MQKVEKQNIWDKDVQVEESGYYWKQDPVIYSKGNIGKVKKPTVVELFCGCGGTSVGFEMAGYDVILGIDIHKPSIETFSKNHKNAATILGDIKKIDPNMVKRILKNKKVDVLIAGVPCQGFSLNNRKRHKNDSRNFLFKEFVKYIEILKPRVAVLENVSGMVSTANGDFVRDIKEAIGIAGEMTVESKILFAPDYGVPQMRKRLVFVGLRGNKKFSFDDDVKKTNGLNSSAPYNTVKDAIFDLPKLQPNEEGFIYKTEPKSEYQKLMRKNSGKKVFNHKAPNHPLDTIEKIKNTKPGESIYAKFKQRIRLSWSIQSPTQVSGGIRPQFQFGHPVDSRGLSIRERCRIQSFPDDFIVSGGIVQGRVQTGNAVPPLLAKALALGIKKYLK